MKLKKKKVVSRKFFDICSYYGLNYLVDSETGQGFNFPDDYVIEDKKDKKCQ